LVGTNLGKRVTAAALRKRALYEILQAQALSAAGC
jgi:hypothetical protein